MRLYLLQLAEGELASNTPTNGTTMPRYSHCHLQYVSVCIFHILESAETAFQTVARLLLCHFVKPNKVECRRKS